MGKPMIVAMVVVGIAFIAFAVFRSSFHWPKNYSVMVIQEGPNYGRVGNIVSIPWLGNGWNMRLSLNVPANESEIRARYGDGWKDRVGELVDDMKKGHGPREWISLWSWEVRN